MKISYIFMTIFAVVLAAPNPAAQPATILSARVTYCGGIAGLDCPGGYSCVDDSSDACDPDNGGTDCIGICVVKTRLECGGFAGIVCPDGYKCVDDPDDDCDPEKEGADCIGICVG